MTITDTSRIAISFILFGAAACLFTAYFCIKRLERGKLETDVKHRQIFAFTEFRNAVEDTKSELKSGFHESVKKDQQLQGALLQAALVPVASAASLVVDDLIDIGFDKKNGSELGKRTASKFSNLAVSTAISLISNNHEFLDPPVEGYHDVLEGICQQVNERGQTLREETIPKLSVEELLVLRDLYDANTPVSSSTGRGWEPSWANMIFSCSRQERIGRGTVYGMSW